MAFLNHGSFGACPTPVLERQTALRGELEREPVQFLTRKLRPMLEEALERVAGFVRADPAGTVFVRNATSAVNTVLAVVANR